MEKEQVYFLTPKTYLPSVALMAKFASGKFAKRISDRSGMAFPYNEMVKEWNGSICTLLPSLKRNILS